MDVNGFEPLTDEEMVTLRAHVMPALGKRGEAACLNFLRGAVKIGGVIRVPVQVFKHAARNPVSPASYLETETRWVPVDDGLAAVLDHKGIAVGSELALAQRRFEVAEEERQAELRRLVQEAAAAVARRKAAEEQAELLRQWSALSPAERALEIAARKHATPGAPPTGWRP